MSIVTVGDMMSRDPVSVAPGCALPDAARLMNRMGIRSLLVKDQDTFVGIVTGTDLANQIIAAAEGDSPDAPRTVGDIMSSPMLTVEQGAPLRTASEEMVRHHVRHLVVTLHGNPVGIISARDLLDPEVDVPGAIPFWPNHLLKEVVAALLTIGVMMALVVLSPAPMLHEADPFSTPNHIKPEWYFLAAYQFLIFADIFRPLGEWAPKVLGVAIMGLVTVIMVLLPFLDRNPDRTPRKRPISMLFGISCTLAFIGFTLWGHFS